MVRIICHHSMLGWRKFKQNFGYFEKNAKILIFCKNAKLQYFAKIQNMAIHYQLYLVYLLVDARKIICCHSILSQVVNLSKNLNILQKCKMCPPLPPPPCKNCCGHNLYSLPPINTSSKTFGLNCQKIAKTPLRSKTRSQSCLPPPIL